MSKGGLVLGLLDTSALIGDAAVAARARDLTLAWSRFKYTGRVIEDGSLDRLLRRAADSGARYGLVQSYGHILAELWKPGGTPFPDFLQGLETWVAGRAFLVAGHLRAREGGWYGLDPRCLVVDLRRYARLGHPACDPPRDGVASVPRAVPRHGPAGLISVEPATGAESVTPTLPAWGLVRASLEAGLPVCDLGPELRGVTLHLDPERPAGAAVLRRALAESDDPTGPRAPEAGDDAAPAPDAPEGLRFLHGLRAQAARLRRSVFVWNLESYDDVREPPEGLRRPLRALYSVAAGLKPNFMLHALGAGESTRVVYFDYSAPGLAFRRLLRDEWDGHDYPRFLRFAFRRLSSEGASFCLWDEATPDTVDWHEMERRWQQEIDAWGGARALLEHWRLYRRLPHEYVPCDLMADPGPALARLRDEADAAVWWSNAFSSVASHWTCSAVERERRWRAWIEGLAARAPGLFLYGATARNVAVNGVRAGQYRDWYARRGGDELEPARHPRAHALRF